jgi:hypothetical protein
VSLFAITSNSDVISEAVADAVDAAHAAAAVAWATDMSALQLAYDLADEFAAPVGDVWFSICNLPENILVLLDSPQGWSALSAVVGFDLGLPASGYGPTVH